SAAENNAHLTIKVDELSTALVAEKEIRQRLDEQWKQRIDREATIQKNKIKEKIRFPLEEALRCLDREGNPNVKMAIERMRQIFIALDIGEGKGR
ncbi:MAG TPA: hypothetical protein PKM25_19015, partial [Candidatus Ozemobacteraceae bacterium]|nr:hypothetical protein [Candidatus Ozemobacteraceae bacterium]